MGGWSGSLLLSLRPLCVSRTLWTSFFEGYWSGGGLKYFVTIQFFCHTVIEIHHLSSQWTGAISSDNVLGWQRVNDEKTTATRPWNHTHHLKLKPFSRNIRKLNRVHSPQGGGCPHRRNWYTAKRLLSSGLRRRADHKITDHEVEIRPDPDRGGKNPRIEMCSNGKHPQGFCWKESTFGRGVNLAWMKWTTERQKKESQRNPF